MGGNGRRVKSWKGGGLRVGKGGRVKCWEKGEG